jgi:putative hemolysin
MDRAQLVLAAMLPVLLVASAFASASETALFGVTPGELARLRRVSPTAAAGVERLRAMPTRLLGQVLLINMVANTAYFIASSVLTVRAESAAAKGRDLRWFGARGGVLRRGAGQVVRQRNPGALPSTGRAGAPGHPRRAVLVSCRVRSVHHCATVPPRGAAGIRAGPDHSGRTGRADRPQRGRGRVQGSEQGLLRSIVTLGSIRVREVMRPRRDLVIVERTAPVDAIVRVCAESGHARVPVCQGGLDGEWSACWTPRDCWPVNRSHAR